MLTYAESFGLVIFVYALGLQVGPGFFSSMRADGLRLVSPAIAIVLLGTALAMAMSYAFGVSMPDMSGILCGATTKAECSTNNSLSHSIPSTVETVAKVGQIFRIAAFLQNEKWSVCVRAYYFAFSGYDILVEPYYKNALPIVGWDNLSTFVLLG